MKQMMSELDASLNQRDAAEASLKERNAQYDEQSARLQVHTLQDYAAAAHERSCRRIYGGLSKLWSLLGPYCNTGPNLGDPKRDHNFDNLPYA